MIQRKHRADHSCGHERNHRVLVSQTAAISDHNSVMIAYECRNHSAPLYIYQSTMLLHGAVTLWQLACSDSNIICKTESKHKHSGLHLFSFCSPTCGLKCLDRSWSPERILSHTGWFKTSSLSLATSKRCNVASRLPWARVRGTPSVGNGIAKCNLMKRFLKAALTHNEVRDEQTSQLHGHHACT